MRRRREGEEQQRQGAIIQMHRGSAGEGERERVKFQPNSCELSCVNCPSFSEPDVRMRAGLEEENLLFYWLIISLHQDSYATSCASSIVLAPYAAFDALELNVS